MEAKNNFSYPVEVNDSLVLVTSNGEWIASGLFEFESNEVYLNAKQSKQLELNFPSANFYDTLDPATNLTNITLYAQTTITKK